MQYLNPFLFFPEASLLVEVQLCRQPREHLHPRSLRQGGHGQEG